MTLFSDELSGDVRHVTCTCSLLLSFSPFSSPILLPPRFLSSLPASPCLSSTSVFISTAYACLSLLCIHVFLALFLSVSPEGSFSVSVFSLSLCPYIGCLVQLALVILSYPLLELLVLTAMMYSEAGSYPVSTTVLVARFVNNSSRLLRRATVIVLCGRSMAANVPLCDRITLILRGLQETYLMSRVIRWEKPLNYCKLLYPIFSVFNNVAFLYLLHIQFTDRGSLL